MKKQYALWTLAIIGLLFSACGDDDDNSAVTPDIANINEEEILSQFTAADQAFSQTFISLSQLVLNPETNETGVRSTGCPNWIFSTEQEGNVSSLTIGFDWGEGCESDEGDFLSGKIRATFEGEQDRFGSIALTFDNFTYNDTLLNGSLIGSIGIDDNGQSFLRGELIDGLARFDSRNAIALTFDKQFVWAEGNNTPRISEDDIFKIYGQGSYVSTVENQEFALTFDINNPVTFETECAIQGAPFYSEGSISLSLSQLGSTELENTYSIDYGDGNCDADITLDLNGTIVESSLLYFWFL